MQIKNKFIVFITMNSDWHISSGTGIPGNVDRVVIRDRDGYPYIPAKTLTGIWRDACEQVALGLDNGNESGVWNKYVHFLFGDQPFLNQDNLALNPPLSAALQIRPAQFHQDIKLTILSRQRAGQKALTDAITFVKAANSIESQTGCTEEKSLRYEELIRLGSLLQAECELDLNLLTEKKQQKVAFSLLIAGAKLIEKLGGKRRRGAGNCSVQIGKEKATEWIDWIEETYIKKETIPDEPKFKIDTNRSNTANFYNQTETNTNWIKIPLTITTKLPVIIKNRTVGNVVESLDYIPGSNLLPIIAKKLSNLGINVKSAIANFDLIITNATIQINNQPGLPVPFAFYYEKMNGGFEKGRGIYNKFKDIESKQQLKPYREGYIGYERGNQGLPNYAKVNKIIQTHNTIEDRFQCPTADLGGIYSYQAIESGTILSAELRIKESVLPKNQINTESKKKARKSKKKVNKGKQKIKKRTDIFFEQIRKELDLIEIIGISKKDDYGLVKITVGQLDKIINNSTKPEAQNKLTVWLLSDLLLRNENLRPTISIDILKEVLQQKLNLKLKFSEQIFIRQQRTESWHKRWSLPRPSLVGLMAGSCLEFIIVEGNLDPNLLEQLEITGIGERTIEGYGQIKLNNSLLTRELRSIELKNNGSNNRQNEDKKNPIKIKFVEDKDNIYYAKIIEKVAWQNAIYQAALTLGSQANEREKLLGIKISDAQSYPSMSQLGNLRSQIRQLQQYDDSEQIIEWINNIIDKDRGKKWEKTSDGLNKIVRLLQDKDLIWRELLIPYFDNLGINFIDLTLTKNGAEKLKKELWAEAIKVVIYESIRAHKRYLEQNLLSSIK